MAIENDAAAEIASELASLQAEQGSPEETEEAAPEADSVESDPEADEESEETEGDTEEPEDGADDEEGLEDAPADASEATIDEVRELIDAGDLKGAAEKLGLDPAIFKLDNRKFKASRTAVREAKAAKTEAEARAAAAEAAAKKAEELNQAAEDAYGPVVAGRFFYKGDARKGIAPDPLKARAAIELLFDDSYENIVTNLAKAAKGMDPAQMEVFRLRQELEAEKAAKAKENETATAAQQKATEVAGIAAKLKGTALEELADEAAAEIHAIVAKSYNPALKRHTKTVKEAYKEVKAAYAAKAAKLAKLSGGKPPAATPAATRKPLDKTKLAPRVPGGKKLTPEQEFEAELAAVKKETQAALRREQRRAK